MSKAVLSPCQFISLSVYLCLCVCLSGLLSVCVCVCVCVCLGVCLVRLSPSVAWASVAYHEMNALFRPGFRCGVPTGWWLSPRPQAPAYLQLRLDGGHVPWLFHGKLHWGGELRQSGEKSRMELPLSFEKGSSVRVLNPAKFPVVTHNWQDAFFKADFKCSKKVLMKLIRNVVNASL